MFNYCFQINKEAMILFYRFTESYRMTGINNNLKRLVFTIKHSAQRFQEWLFILLQLKMNRKTTQDKCRIKVELLTTLPFIQKSLVYTQSSPYCLEVRFDISKGLLICLFRSVSISAFVPFSQIDKYL